MLIASNEPRKHSPNVRQSVLHAKTQKRLTVGTPPPSE